MFRTIVIVLVLMTASLLGSRLIDESLRKPANETVAKQTPQRSADTRSVMIASENGHFATDGRVDGRPVAFIVDTGASQITLRASEADRLGYRTSAQDYVIRITTANGEGLAAPIELSMVEVGEISVRDVPALVVPDGALSVNLLGMSFLSRVHWTHERGQLVLEQ
jgi:aspartyl protease family protein